MVFGVFLYLCTAMEESKNKIITYATGIFIQNGCRRITMDSIASDMHISKRTLYEQFGTKEELLSACLEYMMHQIEDKRRLMEAHVKEPILRAMFHMQSATKVSQNGAMLMNDVRQYYPEIYNHYYTAHNFDFEKSVRQTLIEADEAGLLRPNFNLDRTIGAIKSLVNLNPDKNSSSSMEHLSDLSEAGFTFIRGLLSVETIKKYDEQEIRYKELFKHLDK